MSNTTPNTMAQEISIEDKYKNILSFVEEVGLPDGEYLKVCNALQALYKHISEKDEILLKREISHSFTIQFKTKKGSPYCIKLNKIIKTIYKKRRNDDLIVGTVNDVPFQQDDTDFTIYWAKFILIHGAYDIQIRMDDCEEVASYKSFSDYKKFLKERHMEERDEDDDDDFDCCINYFIRNMFCITYDFIN